MKYLLDTHVLLWAAEASQKLSPAAQQRIEDPDCVLYFSAASLWEIAIKRSLGCTDFFVDVRVLRRGLLDNGYEELPITSEHAVYIDSLPSLHKDPFDRILIAQATVEGITLLTADSTVAQYPGPVEHI